MLARLVLIFYFVSLDANAFKYECLPSVSADSVRLAMRYMDKVFLHARAIYGAAFEGGTSLELARAMARSILADRMESFNRSELTHACRKMRGVARYPQDQALNFLSDMGWIAGGTQWGERWTVNPGVHDLFAEEGERHRQLREEVKSLFTEL
jgi:hypothetical protein